MSDTPEQLWARAHEHVKRGDFASAVRDLAACFQLLQAKNDPRVYEVHKRWTEVHRMYLEDGARQEQPAPQQAPSVEAEAEAAANAGDLDRAIALYEQAARQAPHNELVRERLQELVHAKRRATELTTGTAPPTPAAPATPAATSAKADDDWSDVAIVEESPAVVDEAPAMAVEDAPVGMQSLDVPLTVGEAIDAFQADELPVDDAPAAANDAPQARDDVAFLEELLARVQANRRKSA